MPAPENLDTRARLLGYARWAAIGLAVLAALLLAAVGGETSLRIAAFLAILAVVLVVLSITMNGPESTKVHLEERLLDEIDMLRDDVRADITTAARATHRALAEKVAHLHENVEYMRRTADARALGEAPPAPRPTVAAPPQRRAIGSAGGPGVVHHTETVHVTTHQTYVDPAESDRADRADRYAPRPPARRPEREEPARADWSHSQGHRPEREDRYAAPEPAAWDDGRERRPAPPRGGSRTDDRSRANAPRAAVDPYDDSGEIPAWRGQQGSPDDDPAEDPRWSGMRSGDRWAEVRTDDRGRELRMGERRKTVRADETGTQMRIVDRWSSVREDSPHAEPPSGYRVGSDRVGSERLGSDQTGETRRQRRQREEAEESDRSRSGASPGADRGWLAPSRPALPATGPESAAGWMTGRDGQDDDDRRESRRSRREISGEIIRPDRAEPARVDASWSTPPRPEARRDEPRSYESRHDPRPHQARVPDQRGYDSHPSDQFPSWSSDSHAGSHASHARAPEPSSYDQRPVEWDDHRGGEDHSWDDHGGRDDNRWERDSGAGRSASRQRRLDFDVSDDRWR